MILAGLKQSVLPASINDLLNDYEQFTLDNDTKLIYRALELSSRVLAEDKNQLPAQLIGRLGHFDNITSIQLLQKAKLWKKKSWLRPLRPSLTPPGDVFKNPKRTYE